MGMREVKELSGSIEIEGKLLEFRRIPAQSASEPAPAIVMLHEGLGSVSHWREFPDRLAAETGREVWVYSRYGYGASNVLQEARPVSYMHDEARVVLPAVLKRLDIRHPVLLGHSDGASIALLYAAACPENVSGLVLEAPHIFVEDVTVESIAKVKTLWESGD